MATTYHLTIWGPNHSPSEAMFVERHGIPKTEAEMLDKLLRVSTQVGGVVAIPQQPRIVKGQLAEDLTDLRISTAHIEQWAFTEEGA